MSIVKEFDENLIERLEQLKADAINEDCPIVPNSEDCEMEYSCASCYLNAVIKFVNQLAEEYKQDLNKNKQGWIPCSEMLPEPEKEVLIMANRKYTGGKIIPIITTAIYENGTILENDSIWNWSDIEGEWNEEEECYIIPEGWFEYRHYNPDEVYNNAIDDKVIAWQPLPEPYKPTEQKKIPADNYIERFNRVI